MHAGRLYSIKNVFLWTRRETYVFAVIAAIPTLCYYVFRWPWLHVPWLPIALVGTAVAFLIGFKNNASYDRLWEARKIWGAIVNDSRALAIMLRSFVGPNDEVTRRMIYRHIAWLTALRYQLRTARPWENMETWYNREFRQYFPVPEKEVTMHDAIAPYLSSDEAGNLKGRSNCATHLLDHQGQDLTMLVETGRINEYQQVQVHEVLKDLVASQGMCERIKNFPYPRQFATINQYFVWTFIALVPFGMLTEFESVGIAYVWLTIPFSTLVAWIFHTMEKIGEATENPFEGGANDVPMAAIARAIEIDLREMLGDEEIPEPLTPTNNILM